MKYPRILFATAMATATLCAQAQMAPGMAMPNQASAPKGAPTMTAAVVQRVDTVKSLLVLKHGDIVNLGMPAMTMGFGVADPAMLAQVKAGDQVEFHVEMVKGAATVTSLKKMP